MSKILPIFIASLILAGMAQYCSVYDLKTERYIRKDKFFFCILAAAMTLFVGLRTAINDTTAYTHGYELIKNSDGIMHNVDWFKIGDNPGFNFTNNILHALGVSTQSFLMFYAVITVCIYIWFIRKYTDHIWLSIFLFFTMGVYTFTLAAIKQCVAVAFCLIATDCALRKKWIPFVIWILIACTFHPYSLMFFAVPFLTFKPWGKKTYITLAIFGVLGISLQALLGKLVDVTTMLGEEYSISSFSGEGVNIFRLAVVWSPVILSWICHGYQLKSGDQKRDRADNLMMNLTMLNAEIMFIARFGTANYFARLANYFLIFQVIALPAMLKNFTKRSQKALTVCIVVCYMLYFIYANYMYGSFDANYKSITITEYLRQLF